MSNLISGSVGVSGVTVNLTGAASASTTSGVGGTYSFTALAPGTYIVTPSTAGKAYSPTNRTVVIVASDVTGVNFAQFTPSKRGSNSATVDGAGSLFGVGNITDIESPNTSEIGTDLGTEIRK